MTSGNSKDIRLPFNFFLKVCLSGINREYLTVFDRFVAFEPSEVSTRKKVVGYCGNLSKKQRKLDLTNLILTTIQTKQPASVL